jgi:hypothetical protein
MVMREISVLIENQAKEGFTFDTIATETCSATRYVHHGSKSGKRERRKTAVESIYQLQQQVFGSYVLLLIEILADADEVRIELIAPHATDAKVAKVGRSAGQQSAAWLRSQGGKALEKEAPNCPSAAKPQPNDLKKPPPRNARMTLMKAGLSAPIRGIRGE